MLIQIKAVSGNTEPERSHWINPDRIDYTEECVGNTGLYLVHFTDSELIVTEKVHTKLLKLTNKWG